MERSNRRVALVTGASNGIGKGIALELAEKGWDIAFTYNNSEDGARDTAEKIAAFGVANRYYQATLQDLTVPEAVVNQAYVDFGRLDAIVCNAARDRRGSVLNITPDQIAADTAQLYSAQMLLAGAAARHFIMDKVAGGILFISSVHGQMPITSDFLYGGMKAALERSCKSLALELSPYRIRVNCIAPGAINVRNWDDTKLKYPYSEMVPLGRRGYVTDIAYAAEFLLSDRAAYITGQTLTVDGGFALPGMPEGWAQAHPVDLGFVQRSYEQMIKDEEEKGHV